MRYLLIAALAVILGACAQIEAGSEKAQDLIKATMDKQCGLSIPARQTAYNAFGDRRLLPFDCNLDTRPDFVPE